MANETNMSALQAALEKAVQGSRDPFGVDCQFDQQAVENLEVMRGRLDAPDFQAVIQQALNGMFQANNLPVAAPDNDPLVQISFAARFSTRKRMFQVARDNDMTLKALILDALREKYPELGIEAADLIDLRAKR